MGRPLTTGVVANGGRFSFGLTCRVGRWGSGLGQGAAGSPVSSLSLPLSPLSIASLSQISDLDAEPSTRVTFIRKIFI